MAQSQPAVRTVPVSLSDNAIDPSQILIPANYPIRFVVSNVGSKRHNLTIPHAYYAVDLLPGQSREVIWTFVDVGTFPMFSDDDDDAVRGLRGELVVDSLI